MTLNKVPKLRFPRFNDKWEEKRLDEIGRIIGGGTPDTKNPKYWGGSIYWLTPTEVKNKYIDSSIRTITELGLKNSSAKILPVETVIFTSRATVGDVAIAKISLVTNQGFQSIIVNEKNNNYFIYYWAKINKNEFLRKASGSTFPEISSSEMKKIRLKLPSKREQNKIADFLTQIDNHIDLQQKKLDLLKKYKKGLLQQIFSQKLRFKDDNDKEYPKWEEKELGDLLNYEQPTDYLIKSTNYNNNNKTPVLTAGKSFILGYTNENFGIFNKNKLPVIIFDDFTTAIKYVDFPFKIKSSAIKILKANKDNKIKFIFEAIGLIKYRVGGHERHWISKFRDITIQVPSIAEQEKIANFLTTSDDKINYEESKLKQANKFKKALLQQMFV